MSVALRVRFALRALVFALSLFAPGCAAAQAQLIANPVPDITTPAVVFVADGAGNFQAASRTLRAVAESDGYPLRIVTFKWSHGYGRVLADQVCYAHARAEGKRLADEVQAYHAQHPDTPIYLVGHSAGSTVVLTALENLPAGVVDRGIMLSPAVSRHYDLRPALAAVQSGLYVHYSAHDYWYLGFFTSLLGTSDRHWDTSSGRQGFQVPTEGEDFQLFTKLYQRGWQPGDVQLGNLGGHYGTYQPEFLRTHIVPLLQPAPSD
jgi:pimeloyl-ACP methyl ester carboxylesterase